MTQRGTLELCCVHIPPCERNPLVMLCTHLPINDSSGCLHITVYLAVMVQVSWHTADSNQESKGSFFKSSWIAKLYNINLG